MMMAEFDAEKRRDATVGDIRKRVLKQMKLANEGIRSEEELDAILTVLQTDERRLAYLYGNRLKSNCSGAFRGVSSGKTHRFGRFSWG